VSEPGPQRATPAVRKCKSGDVYENARALSRLAKAACIWAAILGRVPGPDALDSSPAPVELAPVWLMSSEKTGSHAKRRCEDRLEEPRKPAARARSDVRGWPARGKIMLERRPRGEPLHEHEPDGGGDPLRKKSRDRRRGTDIGAGSGGASQYAAKSMVLDRISTRNSRAGTI
jgi:hypothetical protein